MASTYSTDISLEKITTGEKAGLWGTITNTNLEILEQAATGYTTVDMASGNVTLSLADGTTANGKNLYLKLTGTLAGDRTLTMPATTTGGTATGGATALAPGEGTLETPNGPNSQPKSVGITLGPQVAATTTPRAPQD